ncbi:hypothetical protein LRQ04_03175 [Paenarthrobacter sp. AR 02]|uniref:hypothetical protein n=1 Tax=Paenarthrobacter sp. AR 02 TaxID=2899821 RepID=UPI001F4133E6|nr:hypothetical protein [Paenarthrobacter sp. AR 02]MCF3138250.1 hypothetical protein [Paenarthrobacter sp. AR 02]
MKQWIRRHPYLALVWGYVIFFVLLTAGWMVIGRRDLLDSLITALMYTVVYVLLAVFQLRRIGKTNQRLGEAGQFRAFLRYPDSRPGSLSGIWNQGIATPSPGVIHFQPAVYDNLEPSGRATEIEVLEVVHERRNVGGKDRKYITGYGYEVLTLLTEGSRVELAARPESLDQVIENVDMKPGPPTTTT